MATIKQPRFVSAKQKNTGSVYYPQCEQYLKDNYIPYNEDIFINDVECHTIDFIIPGAIIKIQCDSDIPRIDRWDKRICKLEKIVPENIKIYFYCSTMPSNDILELLEDYPNLIVVDKFNDIKPVSTDYYITDISFLISLVSTSNPNYDSMLTAFRNINLFCSQKMHDQVTVFMDNYELERLNKFNIRIQNDVTTSSILITRFNIKKNKEIVKWRPKYLPESFNIIQNCNPFKVIHIDYNCYKFKSSNPLKHIDGSTFICTSCNRICVLQLKRDNGCLLCSS